MRRRARVARREGGRKLECDAEACGFNKGSSGYKKKTAPASAINATTMTNDLYLSTLIATVARARARLKKTKTHASAR